MRQYQLTWRTAEYLLSAYLGIVSIGYGVTILVTAAQGRMDQETYALLLEMTGGHVWPVAVPLLGAGVALFVPRFAVAMAAHWVALAVFSFMVAIFLIAFVNYPEASGITWWSYFSSGFLHSVSITSMLTRRKMKPIRGIDITISVHPPHPPAHRGER